jgi:hypothetical protein
MGDAPKLTGVLKVKIERVLTRANVDTYFRESLKANPEKALAKEGFTPHEVKVVGDLRRFGLEDRGVNMLKFRAFMIDDWQ